MSEEKKQLTYADAGVDIDAGNKAVELMKDSVFWAQPFPGPAPPRSLKAHHKNSSHAQLHTCLPFRWIRLRSPASVH